MRFPPNIGDDLWSMRVFQSSERRADRDDAASRPARGIVVGCLLGLAIWAIIGLFWLF